MRLVSLHLLLVFLVISSCFVACKKDDPAPTAGGATTPSQLVGTWVPNSVTVNGNPETIGNYFNWVQGTASCRMVFNAAGGYAYEELDANNSVLYANGGTLAVSGTSVTVTMTTENGQQLQQPQVQFQGTWAVNGNQLTLTGSGQNQGHVLVFTKV